MADVTPETVLDKISHGHLECPICQERFNDPKLLKCRHSFCKTCLEDMMKAQPRYRQNVICCPACRQQMVIPKAGIAGLDGNFSLMAIVDEVNQQEMLLKRQKSRIACEMCVEKKQAIVRCLVCREYLCQECRTTHKRMKKTTAHKVVEIDDLRSGKVPYESHHRKEVPKCKKHEQQDLLFYCATCDTLICTACAAVDHKTHEVQEISVATTKCEQQISHLLERVEEKLKICKAATDAALISRDNHVMMISDKEKAITQKADDDVARIRENERRLKDQLSKISHKKAKQFQDHLMLLEEKAKQTEDTLDRVKNDTIKIIPFELLKMKDSIVRDLEVAEGTSIPDPVPCLTSEDLKQTGTFTQADLDVLNAVKQRPPIQPRPVKFNQAGKEGVQRKVRDQVTENEAAITPVEVTEDEATITPVYVEANKQVTEDEAAITPVEKEDMYAPPKKFDKRRYRRVIGGPKQNY